jgi:hypothetical protein
MSTAPVSLAGARQSIGRTGHDAAAPNHGRSEGKVWPADRQFVMMPAACVWAGAVERWLNQVEIYFSIVQRTNEFQRAQSPCRHRIFETAIKQLPAQSRRIWLKTRHAHLTGRRPVPLEKTGVENVSTRHAESVRCVNSIAFKGRSINSRRQRPSSVVCLRFPTWNLCRWSR